MVIRALRAVCFRISWGARGAPHRGVRLRPGRNVEESVAAPSKTVWADPANRPLPGAVREGFCDVLQRAVGRPHAEQQNWRQGAQLGDAIRAPEQEHGHRNPRYFQARQFRDGKRRQEEFTGFRDIQDVRSGTSRKFVEFRDTRDCQVAVEAMSRQKLFGWKAPIEHSRAGGFQKKPETLLADRKLTILRNTKSGRCLFAISGG
jgi:hypothetical protein